MIVRNESTILERCLRSVRPFLDCYYICDTGSSDETVAVIDRTLRELPGEVVSLEFHDFAQARNGALLGAQASKLEYDYLLFIDADMELVAEQEDWKSLLCGSAYMLRQTGAGVSYLNTRLIPRESQARYVGAAHEYLQHDREQEVLTGVTLIDYACGSSRVQKIERDLRLLQSALEKDPQDPRTVFYLAQTLREAKRFPEAVELYRKRIALGGWAEEVWYARYMLALCLQQLGDSAGFTSTLLEAYQSRPTRAEPLYALAKTYRRTGQHELSLLLCEEGLGIPRPDDLLFLEEEVYRSSFRHEFSIAGFYSVRKDRRERARSYCRELAIERTCHPAVRENVRENWRHYAQRLDQLFPSARSVPLKHTVSTGFRLCNPSVAFWKGELWSNLRSVNYDLLEPRYCSDDGVIRTENSICRLDSELRPQGAVQVLDRSPGRLEESLIKGLEDIRLIPMGEKLLASATVADRNPDHLRQIAVFELTEEGQVEHLSVQEWGAAQHQKNWVPLVSGEDLLFVYLTDPTIVLKWDPQTRQCQPIVEQPCPAALENQRGSSQAVPFQDGWLYVAHEVSYQLGVRVYLHRFIKLSASYRVEAVTEPFYLHRLGVEFCCGLAVDPTSRELLLSFGVGDQQAWIALLDPDHVKSALIPL